MRPLSVPTVPTFFSLALVLLLSGCQGIPTSSTNTTPNSESTTHGSVQVAQRLGGVQCDFTPEDLRPIVERATSAGIQVQAQSCGGDGMMYAAVCGAPDGRLAILTIPANQLAQAQRLGFTPLSTMPDAQTDSCR